MSLVDPKTTGVLCPLAYLTHVDGHPVAKNDVLTESKDKILFSVDNTHATSDIRAPFYVPCYAPRSV